MASVDSIERADSPATVTAVAAAVEPRTSACIWDQDVLEQNRKASRRQLALVLVGVVACCLALVLGLLFGSGSKLGGGQDPADDGIEQQADTVREQGDHNSLGCFKDNRTNRTLIQELVDPVDMTPDLCKTTCTTSGNYGYYALQYGNECWCGAAGVDIDRYGTGVCDMACPGDSTFICGGDLAYSAYDIDSEAAPPTPTPPGPLSSCSSKATVRYASTIIYVEGGGCATLTDVYDAQPLADGEDQVVFVTDAESNKKDAGTLPTGYWLIARDMWITEGSTLYIHGEASGGDADVVRLQSNGEDDFYEVRGYGGNLYFENTKVTSWDTYLNKEQEKYEGGRSFINCVSEKLGPEDCDGVAKKDMGECRMDIIDSVMGNMGWFDAESYGITWKVRGFCKDLSNPEVFDRTNVYGDMLNSEIYGMYYGHYSYGHQGGVWSNNVVHDNILYGFDPHDDSDYCTISNNTVYGNGNHGIIASKRCNNIKIYNNEVYGGGEGAVGIFLHLSSDNGKIYGNYVHDMMDAGVAVLESMDSEIYDNTFEDVKYGVRLSVGSAGNSIYRNTLAACSDAGMLIYKGSDTPDASDAWNGRPRNNVFNLNVVSNTMIGAKITEGDDNAFTSNVFTGTDTLEFEDATAIRWSDNLLPSGTCIDGNDDFDFTSDSTPPPFCE